MTLRFWTDIKTTDFAGLDAARTVAVLPLAAVEQHGPHLPTGTDALILDGLLARLRERTLDRTTALVLPTLAAGSSPEHLAFPGTLTVGAETLLGLWVDLGRSVARTGIRRLVILNSHGGNAALADVAALRLRTELGLLVVTCTTHRLGVPAGSIDADEARFGIHGGQIETALMLALAPALVAAAERADFASSERDLVRRHPALGAAGGPARLAWSAQDLNPAGAVGNAAAATAAQGEAILQHLADRIAAVLEDAARLPLPDLSR